MIGVPGRRNNQEQGITPIKAEWPTSTARPFFPPTPLLQEFKNLKHYFTKGSEG